MKLSNADTQLLCNSIITMTKMLRVMTVDIEDEESMNKLEDFLDKQLQLVENVQLKIEDYNNECG